jgi:uncharacterized membrane protein
MTAPTPKTIAEYLEQLRAALAGSDPALIQDALYDAEEYLRSELAANPGTDEATLLASMATSYGAPEEVADIYRVQEATVDKALRPPPVKPRQSALGQFFGVIADPRAYTSLLYMLLSLVTGIFYFTWAITGISLSMGLLLLALIGVPLGILFFASVRGISLVEGRLVEVLLGERMPRRPLYSDRDKPLLTRIKEMFTDPRSWSTLLYMLLMLPLGTLYFTLAVTLIGFTFAFLASPLGWMLGLPISARFDDWVWYAPASAMPALFGLGVVMLFATLHLARGIGYLHAQLAKNLLVKSASA